MWLRSPSVSMKTAATTACRNRKTCPLSQVQAGTSVRIKRLLAEPAQCQRLREMGFCEEQQIRLLLRSHNVVCRVCDVRFGLCAKLADCIWVEPLPPRRQAA